MPRFDLFHAFLGCTSVYTLLKVALGFGVSSLFLILSLMSQTPIPLSNGLDAEDWYVINDGVMGGVSESEVMQRDSAIRFQGTVRLENNGGFASIRKSVEPIVEKLEDPHVHLRVMGDGQRFECRFRMKRSRFSYSYSFLTTAGQVTEVNLRIHDFNASVRGRPYNTYEVGHLKIENIEEFGILIADKQQGEFHLDLFEAFIQEGNK